MNFAVFGILLLSSASLHAQYLQFSQYEFTGQRINPAMTGLTRYADVTIDSRSQKTGGDFNINSNFFSASYPLLHPGTGNSIGGIGITLLDDHSSGIFKRQEASLSYALHVRLSRFDQFSLGFKVLHQTARISLDGFNTGSQYVPDRGFDSGISSGENFTEARSHYNTFSTGLHWQRTDRQGAVIAQGGISFFDLNQPAYTFLGSSATLAASVVINGALRFYQINENSISSELLYTHSASNNVVNAGLRFSHSLKAAPRQVADKIDIITRYVPGRSGIVGFQFHRENISFGVSYDFPFLTSNTSNLGALEVGLVLRKLVETKNKKQARRRLIEKQKAAAKTKARKPGTVAKRVKKDSVTVVKDSVIVNPPAVEIVTTGKSGAIDSVSLETKASAGKITHEPMAIEKITLHFQFDYNSVDMDDETENFLNQLASTLKEDPAITLRIAGHTDNIGSEKFNLKLSQRRATVIRNFLIKNGVAPDRLEAIGKGMSEPLNSNETSEDQAKNRRVELLLYRK